MPGNVNPSIHSQKLITDELYVLSFAATHSSNNSRSLALGLGLLLACCVRSLYHFQVHLYSFSAET